MLTTLILSAALCGQSPASHAPPPKPKAEVQGEPTLREMLDEFGADDAGYAELARRRAAMERAAAKARPAPSAASEAEATKARAAEGRTRLLAKRRAKSAAKARAAGRAAEAASRSRAQLEAQYLKMLPFIQAEERIALENQRQQLARMSDIERNAALNRLVSAMERRAGYVYPGQSPSVGPYAGPPNFIPPNPLYAPLIP